MALWPLSGSASRIVSLHVGQTLTLMARPCSQSGLRSRGKHRKPSRACSKPDQRHLLLKSGDERSKCTRLTGCMCSQAEKHAQRHVRGVSCEFMSDTAGCPSNVMVRDMGLRITKVSSELPEYATLSCMRGLLRGRHCWECMWERVGNARVGVAEVGDFCRSAAVYDNRGFRGTAWYVDYAGDVWHTSRLQSVRVAKLASRVQPGDVMTFILDFEEETLKIFVNSRVKEQTVISGLKPMAPLTPIYCLNKQGESIKIMSGRSDHNYTLRYNEPFCLVKPQHANSANGSWIGTSWDPRDF